MSTEQKPTVEEILANPTAHGFEFYTDKVAKGDVSWTVPLVRHLDLDKIEATFGKQSVLDSMDGTSRHVTNQRIARDTKSENATAKEVDIKRAIIENWLGMKSKRRSVIETPVYKYGGVKYETLEAMQDAARVDLVNQGYPEEMIEHFVSRLGATTEAAK